MAYIDCVVDTKPMAQEIDSVSNHIKGTTAAVVGMQAAVIKAEEEASNHVCENVNRGFYTLIHSQISQKIAKLKSEVDSHLMQLNQQRKQLLAIKNRMERDYNMISSRYLKLFNGLNQNLQQRVFELDKPTIEFAVKDVDKITNRTKLLPGTVPVVQLESLEMSQRILASNIKYRGLSVINSMKRFLRDMYAQKRLTDQILLPEQTTTEYSMLTIPVIICESNYDKYDNRRLDIILAQTGLSNEARSRIQSTVGESVNLLPWSLGEAPNAEICSEFNRFLSSSPVSQRVKEMATRLFMIHGYQTVKTR